jgi:4-alpha-glucanotransferase
MKYSRSAGILLHPTSLPSDYGIGELGSSAYKFIDYLERCGVSLWQVLPLGPTGYGDSPYAAFSSFAGNPYLISFEKLKADGYLKKNELGTCITSSSDTIDFGFLYKWKIPLLELAAQRFIDTAPDADKVKFDEFCKENSIWLNDYTLFIVIKEHYDALAVKENAPDSRWNYYWDRKIALKQKKAVSEWSEKYKDRIKMKKVLEFFFFCQWREVKEYANSKGISIIGDIPIFVSDCSADLWSNRKLFHVDKDARQTVVAGVPPDYFSKTGQLWGNPLYNWEEHEAERFSWWTHRIKGMLKLVDIVRIDHFIGMSAYWEIPADAPTAETGHWVKAPGEKLFETLKAELGTLPFIAEDLGVLTPEVEALRDEFEFPGMKILQFAFTFNKDGSQDNKNMFLPFTYSPDTVVYTGTHDNDTTRGWFNSISDRERDLVRRYLGRPDNDIVWDLIREALSSVSKYAIIPMQDLLDLDTSARMNEPSTFGGSNWTWRMSENEMHGFAADRLFGMLELYGRLRNKNG